MKAFILFICCSIVFFTVSCSDSKTDDEGGSTASGSSHNSGKNCLGCHSFTIAGTTYNKALSSKYTGAVITLTSESNGGGTSLGSITSDKSGNFYTNSSVGFGSGIYASVTGTGGTVKHMTSPITSGACNSCHNGTTTSRIWVE